MCSTPTSTASLPPGTKADGARAKPPYMPETVPLAAVSAAPPTLRLKPVDKTCARTKPPCTPETVPLAAISAAPPTYTNSPLESPPPVKKQNGPERRRAKQKKPRIPTKFRGVPLPVPTRQVHTCLHQNANGFRARLRDGSFFRVVDEQNPDAVLITECRSSRKNFKRIKGANKELSKRGYIHRCTLRLQCWLCRLCGIFKNPIQLCNVRA